jgi:hypothetical protein
MVSFTEMLGLYYEFPATLSAAFVIASQLVKSSTFTLLWGWSVFVDFICILMLGSKKNSHQDSFLLFRQKYAHSKIIIYKYTEL